MYINYNTFIEAFTDDIINIAHKTIPKTKNNSKRSSRPWFADEVREAIKKVREPLEFLNHSQPLAI